MLDYLGFVPGVRIHTQGVNIVQDPGIGHAYPVPVVSWTVHTLDHCTWTIICTIVRSYPGLFISWSICALNYSYPSAIENSYTLCIMGINSSLCKWVRIWIVQGTSSHMSQDMNSPRYEWSMVQIIPPWVHRVWCMNGHVAMWTTDTRGCTNTLCYEWCKAFYLLLLAYDWMVRILLRECWLVTRSS